VVLETDQSLRGRGRGKKVSFNNDIADFPFFRGDGVSIKKTDSGKLGSLKGLKVVPEKLVSAADDQHGNALVGGLVKSFLFVALEILGNGDLLPVLTAAGKKEIIFLWINLVFEGNLFHFDFNPPPLAAVD